MPLNRSTKTRDTGSHYRIEQRSDNGHPEHWSTVKLDTRRVQRTDATREEVQIEIEIAEVKNGRRYVRLATLVLDPETATSLATNILTLRP